MNILRAGGDRDRVAFAGNVAVGDAHPDHRAGAVEIEHGGVAEILDQVDACTKPAFRRHAQGAGAEADHHVALARDRGRRF